MKININNFLEFKVEDFEIINNILDREITRIKLCSMIYDFGDSKKIIKKLENVKEKIQSGLKHELEDFARNKGE